MIPFVRKIAAVLALSFSLFTASLSISRAQLLFDNGVAGAGNPNGAPADTGYAYYMSGNVFTPTTTGTAKTITFEGYYANGAASTSDSFTLNLYSAVAGAPSTLLATSALENVTRIDTGISFGGDELYSYTAALSIPLYITTESIYYLGFTDTTTPYEFFNVAGTLNPGPAASGYAFNGVDLVGFNQSLAFSLSGPWDVAAAPEPSSWVLGVISLGLLVCEIRRRRIAA